MPSAIIIKGQKSHPIPFLYLPNGQSHDGVLEGHDHRLQRREVVGAHAAAAALLQKPPSGCIATRDPSAHQHEVMPLPMASRWEPNKGGASRFLSQGIASA